MFAAFHPVLRASRLTAPGALLLLGACAEAPAAETVDRAVPVEVEAVRDGRVAEAVVATGVFGSRDEIPLAFKIGGVIARLQVDEGTTVRRGQTLAALDLREIDALLAKANVALAKATRDEARVRRLHDDSVATRAQWQDAVSALEAAHADVAAARVNRDYAVVTAPEDGVVLRRIATAGATIAPGAPVLVLGGTRRGRVLRAGVPDRDALRVRVGNPATLRFDALPDRTFAGRVTLVGRAADHRTGTYTIEITAPGTETLPSGLVGRVEIGIADGVMAPLVPIDALIEADRDSATVYTVRTDTVDHTRAAVPVAAAHRVAVQGLHGAHASVSGLPAGARVITRGAPYVTDGARVRIVGADAHTAASARKERAP